MGQSRPIFVYFRLFFMTQIKYKLKKVLMVRLGINPGAAGWKARTSPLSYGSTAIVKVCLIFPCVLYLMINLSSFVEAAKHRILSYGATHLV